VPLSIQAVEEQRATAVGENWRPRGKSTRVRAAQVNGVLGIERATWVIS